MARHYTIRSFFRQIPNALLKRFFKQKGLFVDVDFSQLKETQTDELFAAWLYLPEDQRGKLDVELREIFEQSCEKGFKAILDEARFHLQGDDLTDFIEALSVLPNHAHRAMTTFLDYHHLWKGATYFYHADTLSYWRKRKNMGHKAAAVDEASIEQLAGMIRNYFHTIEGRGNNCVVEPFRRGDLDYFFAYPEDYSAQGVEWVDGAFQHRLHNPAFEVVYVYSQQQGTLDLNFRGSFKLAEPLQTMFAQTILKMDQLPPDPKDERVYDLAPLMQRDFDFIHQAGSGIEQVTVKKMRLTSRDGKRDRITLEADTERDPEAVYKLMERIGKSVPLEQYHVTQVELAVQIAMDAEKAAKAATVRITYPNSCSLKYDERDLRLREMLETSGIEPKEPDSEEPDSEEQDE